MSRVHSLCITDGMDRLVRTIWTHDRYRCDLMKVEGRLELWLFDRNMLRRLATCQDSADAREKAQAWLESLT